MPGADDRASTREIEEAGEKPAFFLHGAETPSSFARTVGDGHGSRESSQCQKNVGRLLELWDISQVRAPQAVGYKIMRTFVLGLALSAVAWPCLGQTILKTEPLSLAPYQSAYVSDGSCAAGKVLRVTGAMRNMPRKKVCVSLGLEQASLAEQPL